MGIFFDKALMYRFVLIFLLSFAFFLSYSSVKNTKAIRWYHSFNTHYNVYFNANAFYQEALRASQKNCKENYSDIIRIFPIGTLPKDEIAMGGIFDRAIEKSVKAIKTHSIQTKPTRNKSKINDSKYLQWINQTEYNPFLYNPWILMAKSQFYNGDFLQAANSFSYISRLYNTQPEIAITAKLWEIRCYLETDWFYDANDFLSHMKEGELSSKLRNLYYTVYVDYLIKRKEYQKVVPYLKKAIQVEKNKFQKNREKYLLGQIYSRLDQKNRSYEIFREVANVNTQHVLGFNARIRQTEVYTAGRDTTRITKQLRKMIKNNRNKDYLDQLYYALGNIYMAVSDTTLAIYAYETGVEKSIKQSIDKVLNQIRLGDIFFTQRKFTKAQSNYVDALHQLTEKNEAYIRVFTRSAILDKLKVYVKAVDLQDSLQRLSKMSEEERMEIISRIIDKLKEKEIGKIKNEIYGNNEISEEWIEIKNISKVSSVDLYSTQFYLQQIPVTEEDIKASNLVIIDGLYNMALIYKDDLEDTYLALETFDMLNSRFPDNGNRLKSYYHTYLIYLKANDTVSVSLYKKKIKEEFPESKYAIAMTDSNYEYNMKMMNVVQDSLYRDTYEAYLSEDTVKIRNNYQLMGKKYPQSDLMAKFMFLNALSYAISNEVNLFREHLKELISKYPDTEVSTLAAEMIRRIQKGLVLSAFNNNNVLAKRDMFKTHWGRIDEVSNETAILTFSEKTETPYKLLIVYPQGTIDNNLLLYTIANFNFSNFLIKDFDLERTIFGKMELLQIKEFRNFTEILQYIQMIYTLGGYVQELGSSIIVVPISLENYAILMRGKTLEEYMDFFKNRFGKNNRNLVKHWS